MGQARRRKLGVAGRQTAGTPPGVPPASQRPARARAPRPYRSDAAFPPLQPDSAAASWTTVKLALAGVIGLGIVLRLAHLAWVREAPFFSSLLLDARAYDEWAQQIAGGTWIGTTAFWVDPLYAYVLGAVYGIAGHDLLVPRLLNAALGVATALVVAATAWRVWGSRLAAVAAALLVALFVPAIHFEGQIEKTALTIFLLSVGLYLFLIGTTRAIALAGVVIGLAALARGNMLLFVPLAALALALGWDREPGDPLAATRPRRLQRAALLLGCGVPVILLATVHNYLATGELVPTTTNLGINLYLGNHPNNLHGYYDAPAFLTPSTNTEVPDFRREAQRRSGRTLGDRELSSFWTGQAWESIAADPGLAVSRELKKLQLALHNDEVPDSESVELIALWSPVVSAPVFWFGQLLALAVLGAVVGWRRRAVRILVVVAATYIASLLPFFIMARLRVQVLPPLAVLGGGAVAWIAAMATARRTRSLVHAGLVLAAVGLVAFYRPDWMADRRTSSRAIGWHNLGATLADSGRLDDAARAYEHAVEIDEKAVPAALRALGKYYQSKGDHLRAETAMRRVVELRPDSPSAREALRGLYDAMLQDARWRDDAQIQRRRQALGAPAPPAASTTASKTTSTTASTADPRTAIARARSLMAAGKKDEAIAALQTSVRDGPYDEDLHYMLGETMLRHSTPDAVVEFFSSEVGRDQKPQTSHYYWALALQKRGDADGAVAHFQQALEIDPAHEMSQHRWGLLLEQQGKPDEALAHLEEATRIHPEFTTALQDAARVADQLGRTADAEAYRHRAGMANFNSPRRYIYWARYLHEHGRHAAALPEIDRRLAEQPGDAEALALRAQVRAALGQTGPEPTVAVAAGVSAAPAQWALAPQARAQLVAALSIQPPGTPTWIVYDGRHASAQAFAKQLAAAFEEARWTVQRLGPTDFAMRAGLFVFAADDPPSNAAANVSSALEATALGATVATGYREFVDERRRADPNWRGFELAADQGFVVAVGRPPG